MLGCSLRCLLSAAGSAGPKVTSPHHDAGTHVVQEDWINAVGRAIVRHSKRCGVHCGPFPARGDWDLFPLRVCQEAALRRLQIDSGRRWLSIAHRSYCFLMSCFLRICAYLCM